MIQNADDNEYTIAERNGGHPYLRFNVHDDRIEVESNEDGFKEQDVRSICSTALSTKRESGVHIGEKGIGFKSVFKVAKKVHILSGPYSFSFNYNPKLENGGLGMVIPNQAKHKELPDSVRTRITLYLHNPDRIEELVQELSNLPDTPLLFLRKLSTIEINLRHSNNEINIQLEHIDDGERLGEHPKEGILKTYRVNKKEKVETKWFWVFRNRATELPSDPLREGNDSAPIALAFPVNGKDEPVIVEQEVYAFLPVRKANFTVSICYILQYSSA